MIHLLIRDEFQVQSQSKEISMYVELSIIHESKAYYPSVIDGITWVTERKNTPGTLKFKVILTDELVVEEGDAVRLIVDNTPVFFGFIFKKKRDKQEQLEITAYDQLRYLKNKETYVYKGKTATQVVQMIARDFNLNVGSMEDTKYVIPKKVEDDKTLFDVIQDALDDTLTNVRKMFVLYDEFGKLTLKNIDSMITDVVIDASTGQDYAYESSIDGQTYNQIKIVYDNDKTSKRDVYVARDYQNINKWGVLQYYEKANSDIGLQQKAEAMLKLYNKKTRTLRIEKAFGDVKVRAGSGVAVILDLGDIVIKNYMLCEKVSHSFCNDNHTMDLTLRGNTFVA